MTTIETSLSETESSFAAERYLDSKASAEAARQQAQPGTAAPQGRTLDARHVPINETLTGTLIDMTGEELKTGTLYVYFHWQLPRFDNAVLRDRTILKPASRSNREILEGKLRDIFGVENPPHSLREAKDRLKVKPITCGIRASRNGQYVNVDVMLNVAAQEDRAESQLDELFSQL